MTIIIKLYIGLVFNLLAISILVIHLTRGGQSYNEALNTCWNRIVLNYKPIFDDRNNPFNGCCLILGRTWWFVIFAAIILWMIEDSFESILVLGLLILIHFYWYFQAGFSKEQHYNRVINLNPTWGIVFQEIDESSILKNRSLAELDLRKKNLLVLAIERETQTISFPKGIETLAVGDRLVIFGDLNYYRGMVE